MEILVLAKDVSLSFAKLNHKLSKAESINKPFSVIGINLQIHRGESLAIIGGNGSGKSTLAKILAGIYKPDSGKLEVLGSVAPLLELGAGFDPELTVHENIYLYGALLGASIDQLKLDENEILQFSELSESLRMPLRQLSSGMQARLAFTIATTIKSDLLIVDEVFSVGDKEFVKKSKRRLLGKINEGTSSIMISHDFDLLREVTSKCIWLKGGKVYLSGTTLDVTDAYMREMT
jgi:ABC-type polysaccharide/polyol phosphate transport system ATPase subunit